MSKLHKLFGPKPNPKNSSIEPEKDQNDPQKTNNQKLRKQKISYKLKVISLYEWPPKSCRTSPDAKNSPIGPKKRLKISPDKQKIQESEKKILQKESFKSTDPIYNWNEV